MHGAPRLTPEIVLQAYAEGLFPMAEARDDPHPLLDLAGCARRHPAGRAAPVAPARPHHPQRPLHRHRRHCLSPRSSPPAPPRRRGARKPGSIPRSKRSTPRCTRRGHAHSIECWQDGELVGGLYGVSLGRGLLRREHVQPRARRQQGRARPSRRAPARWRFRRCSTRSSSPPHLASMGAMEIPRDGLSRARSSRRSPKPPTGPRLRAVRPCSSLAFLLGETGLTGAVEATGGASWPGWLVLQLITQTS